jgi:hypothetical protein
MPDAPTPFARFVHRHPGVTWLVAAFIPIGLMGLLRLEWMDSGAGSLLFAIFGVLGLPFIIAGRLAVAVTRWAPLSIQIVAAAAACIGLALGLDRWLRPLLERRRGGEP